MIELSETRNSYGKDHMIKFPKTLTSKKKKTFNVFAGSYVGDAPPANYIYPLRDHTTVRKGYISNLHCTATSIQKLQVFKYSVMWS